MSSVAQREAARQSPESLALAAAYNPRPTTKAGFIRLPSRTRHGHYHDIRIALDGEPICNCEASFNHLECWAVKLVREEIEMSTETAVAIRPVQIAERQALLPTRHEMDMIREAADMALAGAVALPPELNSAKKVAAVMLYGLELGLKPMTSIRHLYIVKGRVQPSCEVMAGLVMKAEPDCRILVEELTDTECTMRLQRPSRQLSETYTVTWAEIKAAGLADSAMNKAYPRDRLRYHCTKRLLRIYAPDLINSMDGPAVGSMVPSAFSNSDLFNDGDDGAIEGEYTVDRETGEILEPAPEEPAVISHDQYTELANIYAAIVSKEARAEAHTAVLVGAPYADKGDGTVSWMKLLTEDFGGVRRTLNQIVDAQNAAPAAPKLPSVG